jgi:hypothetical protein
MFLIQHDQPLVQDRPGDNTHIHSPAGVHVGLEELSLIL